MAYGIIKVDTVTFTSDGIDKSVSISGLVQNPTFSGNVTVTGTLSGVTVTGTTASFTSGVFTNISGGTHTITSGVFAAGSAASPSISFTSDPDTGLYSPGADQLALSTNGTGRLFVDASGNVTVDTNTFYVDATNNRVGIGTTSPVARLDVSRLGTAWTGVAPNAETGILVHNGNNTTTSAAAVQVSAGSSSTSAVFFGDEADSDTGGIIYGHSDDSLRFRTNADERARIDSSGRLLIGTSTSYSQGGFIPLLQTNVTSSQGIGQGIYRWSNDGGAPLLGFAKSRGTIGSYSILSNGDIFGAIVFSGDDGTDLNTIGVAIYAEVDGTPGTDDMPGRLIFSTTADGASSPTERMRIDSAGFISLGGDTNTGLSNPSADNLAITTGGSERARIDSSGRLLVGTSSSFTIENTITPQVISANNTGSNNCADLFVGSFQNAAGTGRARVSGKLFLAHSRSGTSGSIGGIVGSTDRLGEIRFVGDDGTQFLTAAEILGEVDGLPGLNDMPGRLVFSVTADGASSPTERMRIGSDGKLTHFTDADFQVSNSGTSAVSNAFVVRNGATATGTGTAVCQIREDGDIENTNNSYGAISDAKLKENVLDASSQWDDIKSLQVRKYNFKPETGYGTHTQIGLVAQEVELVSPGLVETVPDRDEDGNDLGTVTKSVNYSVLYMKAVKALQEAMERIETLEAKVAALENA